MDHVNILQEQEPVIRMNRPAYMEIMLQRNMERVLPIDCDALAQQSRFVVAARVRFNRDSAYVCAGLSSGNRIMKAWSKSRVMTSGLSAFCLRCRRRFWEAMESGMS